MTIDLKEDLEVLLVSGVANPDPLKNFLQENSGTYYEILYNDHHIYTIDDWKEILKRFKTIAAANKIILTTEKDAVRLIKFEQAIGDLPLYVIPIEIQFLFNGEKTFRELISKFIADFRQNNKPIDAKETN